MYLYNLFLPIHSFTQHSTKAGAICHTRVLYTNTTTHTWTKMPYSCNWLKWRRIAAMSGIITRAISKWYDNYLRYIFVIVPIPSRAITRTWKFFKGYCRELSQYHIVISSSTQEGKCNLSLCWEQCSVCYRNRW